MVNHLTNRAIYRRRYLDAPIRECRARMNTRTRRYMPYICAMCAVCVPCVCKHKT